jgi:hypothetical protein
LKQTAAAVAELETAIRPSMAVAFDRAAVLQHAVRPRVMASYTNICFVQRRGNKSKQFSRGKSDGGASRAWNQQDLNIQQWLSGCEGI